MEFSIAAGLVLGLMLVGGSYLSDRINGAFSRAADFHADTDRPTKSPLVARAGSAGPATAAESTFADRLRQNPTFLSLSAVLGLGFLAETMILARRRRKLAAEEVPSDTDHSQLPLRLFEKRQNLLRRLGESAASGNLHGLRTRDVMTASVVTLSPYTPIEEVTRLMADRRVRHVLICNEDLKLLGVVSDRDLTQRRGRYARDIMSHRIVSVSGDTELIPAITTMMNRGISALPILHDGRPIGILTTTDAQLVLQCLLLLKHRDETPAGETL